MPRRQNGPTPEEIMEGGPVVELDGDEEVESEPEAGPRHTVKTPPAALVVKVRGGKPKRVPRSFVEETRDYKPGELLAALKQRDIRTGDAFKIWEVLKQGALAGSQKSALEYVDRVFGKPTQNVAVASRVVVELGEEERRIIDELKGVFGVGREMVEGEARVLP